MAVHSVSDVNRYLKDLLAGEPLLQGISVRGEISNFKQYPSGHCYFTLKDTNSALKCVMFRSRAQYLRFLPQNGMQVVAGGSIAVYERDGVYQLYVDSLIPEGTGDLALAFEQLKEKLAAEGLFDPARKQPLPAFPKKIGVVTSSAGAVLRDIYRVSKRRWPGIQLVLYPVQVQGEGAAEQIARGIDFFAEEYAVDVIIAGRGGGSMEDLWAFNDEGLARAIYQCKTPIISAVGHETDTTLCDFVSDLRAPTPSAAAELAVPNKADLLENVQVLLRQAVSITEKQLEICYSDAEKLSELVAAHSPLDTINKNIELVDAFADRASTTANHFYDTVLARSNELFTKVEALNPVAVLNRGFAYITHGDNNVSSVKDVKSGDSIDITLKDGGFSATVQ